MSLVIIVTGLLVIFRVLGSSVAGTSTSSRAAQAQIRAAAILEAIRLSPQAALDCLNTTAVPLWTNCETTCKNSQTLPALASAQSCIYTIGDVAGFGFSTVNAPNSTSPTTGTLVNNQSLDRLGQQYFLVIGTAPAAPMAPANTAATYVRKVGEQLRAYEVVVTVGWNDDNSTTQVGAGFPQHRVSMATGLFP